MPRSYDEDSEEDFSGEESGSDNQSESDDYQNDDNYSESEGDGRSHSEGEYSEGEYSEEDEANYSEDGTNDDYYDYEKGERSDRFNDEQTIKNDYWWEGREKLIAGILLCWCCLCVVIIAVVLGLVLGRNGDNKDTSSEILPAPTERPTFAPQPLPPSSFTPSPTESMEPTLAITLSPTILPTRWPTLSPTNSLAPTKSIPDNLTIVADQDTFTQYNISKEFQGEEYGLLDTFLVQKVPLKDEELADSIGLLSFPIEDVPISSRLEGRKNSAILRLTHAVVTLERPAANYTVVRIPETKTRMEYWHGFYFDPPEDDEIGVKVGPEFEVNPTDTVIDIDVSSLFYNYTLVENRRPKKVFFMIENRGPDQIEGGDRFYTRESETPPLLLLNFEDFDSELDDESQGDEGN